MNGDAALFKTLAKAGGVGGIALGVFLVVYRELIHKLVFPQLSVSQAYKIILVILFFTFGIALVGLTVWALKTTRGGRVVVLLLLLFGLALCAIGSYVIQEDRQKPDPRAAYAIVSAHDVVDFGQWRPFLPTEGNPISVVTRTIDLVIERVYEGEALFDRIASTSSRLGLKCEVLSANASCFEEPAGVTAGQINRRVWRLKLDMGYFPVRKPVLLSYRISYYNNFSFDYVNPTNGVCKGCDITFPTAHEVKQYSLAVSFPSDWSWSKVFLVRSSQSNAGSGASVEKSNGDKSRQFDSGTFALAPGEQLTANIFPDERFPARS